MNGYPTFTVEQVDAATKNHALAGMGVAVARQVLILGESVEEAANVLQYPVNVARRAVTAMRTRIAEIQGAYRGVASPDRMTDAQFYCCMRRINRAGAVVDAAYECLVLGTDRFVAARRNGADASQVRHRVDLLLQKHRRFIHAYGGHHEHEQVLP